MTPAGAGADWSLTVDDHGPPTTHAVVVLHGFAGDAATMVDVVEPVVASGRRVLVPDLVGHGRSPAPPGLDHYTMDACIDGLAAAVGAHGVERCSLVGYSMGGRVALQWAARRAGAPTVESLVTIGATPGIAEPDDRAARVADDESLADRIESEGIEWFARWWADRPIFASQTGRVSATAAARVERARLGQRSRGLANSLRGMGTGAMAFLAADELADLGAPLTALAGVDDHKFCAIGAELARAAPQGRFVPVPGAGHATHLEQPDATAQLVLDGLEGR